VLPRRVVVALAFVLVLVFGVALSLDLAGRQGAVSGAAHRGAARHMGLSSLPLAARGVISETLGASDGAFRVSAAAGGFRTVNPAQHLRARFDRSGVLVGSGRASLGLGLRAVGYGTALRPVGEVAPRARGNRVVYAHPGLSEWYSNGPLGLEQGFTIARAPAGPQAGPLTLSLALSGSLRPTVVDGGRGLRFSGSDGSVLRYDGLVVTDARGRALHSWIGLSGGGLLLRVDARGARYPLRIDPFIQQGAKLTGGEESGKGLFGGSVALSSNGTTALIGGPDNASDEGAAWVFTRSEGKWTQQAKLTGKEEEGHAEFGSSVALSSEGNTASIGGPEDNKGVGAVWVFTRSEGKWTQQGAKLTGKEESGDGRFGASVALSSEGTTALIGGNGDTSAVGAAWVFTQSEGKWTQQGTKLTGKEESGHGQFGASVALSSEGSTALVGGPEDNGGHGALWVFTRSEGKWTQQGSKLTGKEEEGDALFGYRVASSSNGNTAMIGGPGDSGYTGAAWVFTRSEGKWTQQGTKLTGKESPPGESPVFGASVTLASEGNMALIGDSGLSGVYLFMRSEGKWAQRGLKGIPSEPAGFSEFGSSAALSSDGTTALVGGPAYNEGVGAAWAFEYAPATEEQYGAENPAETDILKCSCGKPVNPATGDEMLEQTDLAIGGRGPGLRVTRSYNSLAAAAATEAGTWGYGWSGPYSSHLTVSTEDETATVYAENGSDAVFYKNGTAYIPASWVQATLVTSGSNYIYTLPDQTKLEFNSEGRLVKETDRDGNSNTLTYKEGKLEKVEDGDKRTLTFKYNGEGLVESVKDPMGHVVSYTYSSKNLASVTIEGKVRWEYTYESPHLLTKVKDGRGHTVTDEYEATTHRVVKQEQAGHTRKWKYGTNETTLTEPNGSETVEHFNGAGEPTKVTRAKGVSGVETTTEYVYNSTFELEKLIDGNGHETKYSYDAEGNKLSETDPTGDERKWTYDKKHDVETETTSEGETTTYKRNGNGDPEVIERPIGSEVQKAKVVYNEKGDVTEVTDPLGHTTKYTYDAAGDKETEKDPESDERKWKYNEDSQETEETSPRGYATKTERDERGLPVKITDPLAHTTEYKYDGDQNIESETDGNKHTTKYEYNEENLQTKVEEPNKDTVEMEYDSEGKMTARKDGNGHKWEYKRNALEQVAEEKNPLGKVWKKTYDKAGNLEKMEDPEKHTTEYGYDKSNRLEKIKYSTGKPSEVTYEYNKDGKVKKMTDETGTTENTWDKLDRLTKYKNGAGKTVEYEYNLANLPTKITYPNGEHITREYDKDNRLEKVTDWKSNTISFKYNKDSQLEKTTFPSGAEEEDTYGYNEADQMSEIHYKHGATSLGSLTYERDDDGQVKKTTTGTLLQPTSESVLDENNRIIEANKKGYEYDKANNPTKLEGTTGYSYNETDELEKGGGETYTYNEDGQRTKTKPTSGPATTYGYDQAGNLTSIERPEEDGESWIGDTFTYDGNNLRQTQTLGFTKTNLTWDTAEPIPIILSDENYSYIYGPENLPIEQIPSTGEASYLHHDQQGSTILLTNTKGEVLIEYSYSPFGRIIGERGGLGGSTLLRYDGQYETFEPGFVYLRARTYDPSTGQFLTPDPALQGTGEPYAYTKDNPLNYGDPRGEESWWNPCSWGGDLYLNTCKIIGVGALITGALTIGLPTTVAGVAVSVVISGVSLAIGAAEYEKGNYFDALLAISGGASGIGYGAVGALAVLPKAYSAVTAFIATGSFAVGAVAYSKAAECYVKENFAPVAPPGAGP
jgi:RHS repeat-associated protein